MKSSLYIIVPLIIACSCSEKIADREKLLAHDYRLFQQTPLWSLAKTTQDNKFEEMERLIKSQEISVNQKEPKFGQTLIFLTIWNKQTDACAKLLQLGADPNIHQTSDDQTPLILAAEEEDSKIAVAFIKLLLKYGADPNEVQTNKSKEDLTSLPLNSTPLIAACGDVNEGSDPLLKVKLLIDAGANVKYVGNNNNSALREALFLSNYDVALYLLEKGADYNVLLCEGTKYDVSKPTYILDFLRQQLFAFDTKEYRFKMKVIDFLKTKGLDYRGYPIHPDMIEEIKKAYPNNWEEYLKKY